MAKKTETTNSVDTKYPAKKNAKKLVLNAKTTDVKQDKKEIDELANAIESSLQPEAAPVGDKVLKVKKEPVKDLASLAGVLEDKGIDVPKVEEVVDIKQTVPAKSPLPVEGTTKPAPKHSHDKGAPNKPYQKHHNANYGRPYQGKPNGEVFRNNGMNRPEMGVYPEHIVQMVLIIKNNAEIRRYTALGVLNYLLQKGEIRGGGRFVDFKWDKFVVKCGNLVKEYEYVEVFFINCFVASFSSFSASAQNTIDTFLNIEKDMRFEQVYDEKEVQFIVNSNEGR